MDFKTMGYAIAAGYQSVRDGQVLAQHGEYDIIAVDTSGPRWYGYSFGVRAIPNDDAIRAGYTSLGPFGSTVTVWTDDPNRLGEPGSFRPMFAPGELDRAITDAINAIDQRRPAND